MAESAEAAIVGADAEGRITCWNRGAHVLYGYTAREACGQLGSMLHPPERRGDFEFILRRVHNGQTITNYETIRQRKDGSTFPVSLIVSPIRAGDGRVVGLSSIAHDISERQRAERAVQLAEVGQLASGLVHEIRNPLNAMRMQIAVIQDSLESPQAADLELACGQLERLEGEVLRVQKLADNFLAYGRPSRDNPQRIELRELLGKVAEFVRPEFNRARIAVELQLEESGGPLAVCMDRDKLRQILVNVAENARQATPRGGSLTIAAGRPDPDHVEIRLSDQPGRGSSRTCCRASSGPSSPPRRKAPAWAWRSSRRRSRVVGRLSAGGVAVGPGNDDRDHLARCAVG